MARDTTESPATDGTGQRRGLTGLEANVLAWCNGRLVDESQPVATALDHGLTVGDGVFETLKVIDGVPFALRRHLDRLSRSAAGLGLPAPDQDLVRLGIAEVLAANQEKLGDLGRLRVTYTSGPGPLGSDRGPGPGLVAVAVTAASPWPASTAVAVSPWPRNERSPLAGLKTTSYAENAVALDWAKQRGCSEAVMANLSGDLCEGTGSNIFVVAYGRVLTPPLDSGCLAGITRELVLEWTDAVEERLPIDVLTTADEIFLVSSTRDVQPVHQVDDRELDPGPVTQEIAEIFSQCSTDRDP